MNIETLVSKLEGVSPKGRGFVALCPAHDDSTPSLSVDSGTDGRVLLHCFAGCIPEAIVTAIGCTLADLAPPRGSASTPGKIVTTYDYVAADGRLVFQVVRLEPKSFRQRRPDPAAPGKWLWNMLGVDRILYRLPEVTEAIACGETVYVVEGEKDANNLAAIELCATCNVGGAGKWEAGYTSTLAGAHVVLIPDRDKPGRAHGQLVARSLHGIAASIRVVELPDRNGISIKDASDWLGAGGTKDALLALVEAAPEWRPTAEEPSAPSAPANSAFDQLVAQYGLPYYTDGTGEDARVIGVNETFWAGLHAHENRIIYEPGEGEFYVYDDATGIYALETQAAIRSKISNRMLDVSREIDTPGLESKRTTSRLGAIIGHLQGIAEQRGAFADNRDTIHLANGVLRFNGGDFDLLGFSPEFKARNRSPIGFDAEAGCPRFLGELVAPAVHPEDVGLLQRFAGQYLLGYNRSQRILILDGGGADGGAGRGKTQFANVMQHLVGLPNVTQLRTTHLAERFELFRYLRKTFLCGVDVPPDFLSTKGAAVLKGLVGGDYFDAEQKGGTGSFQLQGDFNVIITSNGRLRVRLSGDLGAWRRRLCIVRYEAPPPKAKIPDFGKLLIATEGAGILNWALEGAAMVLFEIPESGGDFRLTPRQIATVDNLLAESDSLRHFIQRWTVIDPSQDLSVAEIEEGYADFCQRQGWAPLPITELRTQLEGAMLELRRVTKAHSITRGGKSARGFRGVAFGEVIA
jgi:putative DNA primase/helicase